MRFLGLPAFEWVGRRESAYAETRPHAPDTVFGSQGITRQPLGLAPPTTVSFGSTRMAGWTPGEATVPCTGARGFDDVGDRARRHRGAWNGAHGWRKH
jgi:hypothetical protein